MLYADVSEHCSILKGGVSRRILLAYTAYEAGIVFRNVGV